MEQRILPPGQERPPKLSGRARTVAVAAFVALCVAGIALVALASP